jgi:polyisoprenoid-binding protein YceI
MRHHERARKVVAIASAVAGLLVASSGVARATDFAVRPGKDTNVVFTSNATVETFDGKTHNMTGTLALEPGTVGDSITVHLEVDLASLDTGKSPTGAKLEAGKAVAFHIEGTFALHGVTRRLRCDATATFTPQGKGGAIAFSATFPVTLADYAIKRPEFLFLKLAETQQVRVSAVASSAP